MKTCDPHEELYMNVQISIIQNGPKLEIIQMLIKWINENVACPHSGTLLRKDLIPEHATTWMILNTLC